MSSFAEDVLDDFGARSGQAALHRHPWYLIAGKAGPNAVLKIVVPSAGNAQGYVVTVARHSDTQVIRREVDVLQRLQRELSGDLVHSVPTVAAHGSCRGIPYFGIPFYHSGGFRRIERRLLRRRIWEWVHRWLTELARATLGDCLTTEWLEAEFSETLSRIQESSSVDSCTKKRVQEHFDLIHSNAARIPSVCCHGDMWSENVMWGHGSAGAVVLDWGAARWPGLPAVDLCRYALHNMGAAKDVVGALRTYCDAVDLDPKFVPALYDLYNVFIKAEMDHAHALDPSGKFNPFTRGLPSDRLSAIMADCAG